MKTIIIGSGPAGLTSAIYAGRANLKPIVFEGNQPGGQLTITTDVENYPGFPNGVMGPEMMDLFRDQAKKFGAECFFKHVTKVDFSSKPYKVFVGDDEFINGQYYNAQFFGVNTDLGDSIRVELIEMDEHVYDYVLGLASESESNMFSATPSNPLTNLKGNAIGYFGVYMTDVDSLVIL